MTNKEIIKSLRQKGYGYKKIAKELNISIGSVIVILNGSLKESMLIMPKLVQKKTDQSL